MRTIISVVVGAVLLFASGFVAWVQSPHHFWGIETLPAEKEAALSGLEPGVYAHPWPSHDEQNDPKVQEEMEKKQEEGPLVILAYQPKGKVRPMSEVMLTGFLLMLVTSGTVVALLVQTRIRNYFKRLFFVVGLGFLAGLVGPLGDWNWLGFGAEYALTRIADSVGSFFVMGVVLAGLIPRPKD